MSLSEIEILKQENKSILEGYAKVSDLCKNLIFEIQKRNSRINTLEQEKKSFWKNSMFCKIIISILH